MKIITFRIVRWSLHIVNVFVKSYLWLVFNLNNFYLCEKCLFSPSWIRIKLFFLSVKQISKDDQSEVGGVCIDN